MFISRTHSIGHAAGSQDRGAWPWRRWSRRLTRSADVCRRACPPAPRRVPRSRSTRPAARTRVP